jgi:hypothetical protein
VTAMASRRLLILLVLPAYLIATSTRAADPMPVKVFILAGQSNMEGQAVSDLGRKDYNDGKGTLKALLTDPAETPHVKHVAKPSGGWAVRDDVWVRYQREGQPLLAGPLTVGYAVYGGTHHFGPELQSGHVLGDHFTNQVLLIKTAWGGKSLIKDFRPPSSGGAVGLYFGNGMVKLLPRSEEKPEPPKPTSYTVKKIEGWTVRVDDRLLKAPDDELGARALRFLENKLSDIKVVVPADKVKKLQAVTIVLDLSHGGLRPMQYHPSAEWLEGHGYARDLAKCVHLPRAADLATKRNIREQPWVILHELAHAYHDQVLGFDEPRIKEAYEKFKKSGRGEKALLHDGSRVRHYGLTDHKEFFAEMTESYFGSNDFFPFNRAELKEAEPGIYELMTNVWDVPAAKKERP